MAIVELARIQLRRGRAYSDTGIPQLASGEMAWAIDTQELYIGNGAVAEGAPAVGNTRLLTENDLDNVFDVVDYQYRSYDETIQATPRSLSRRLSDRVTAHDFGAMGDGIANDTLAIQKAIDQLYSNSSGSAATDITDRVILELLPGTYNITQTLTIPSFATLIGGGQNKTIIKFGPMTITGNQTIDTTLINSTAASTAYVGNLVSGTGIQVGTTVVSVVAGVSFTISKPITESKSNNSIILSPTGPVMLTVNDAYPVIEASTYATQPRSITIKNLTVSSTVLNQSGIHLDTIRDSHFENINITGTWDEMYHDANYGIKLTSTSDAVISNNNIFKNINITQFSHGVYSDYDILNNIFDTGLYTTLNQGFCLGQNSTGDPGQLLGARETTIRQIKFVGIKQHGIIDYLGTNNSIEHCNLINVGNESTANSEVYGSITYPQIYFRNSGNSVNNITSTRGDELFPVTVPLSGYSFIPVISGSSIKYTIPKTYQINIVDGVNQIFKLPAVTNDAGVFDIAASYTVDYVFKSTSVIRCGQLKIIFVDILNKIVKLTDEYVTNRLSEETELLMEFGAEYLSDPDYIMVTCNNGITDNSGTLDVTYGAVVTLPLIT